MEKELEIHDLYERARAEVYNDTFTSLRLSQKGLALAKETGNILFQFRFSLFLARSLQNSGDVEKALETIFFTKEIAERYFHQDAFKMSDLYLSMGLIYYYLDYKELVLEYSLKAFGYNVKEHRITISNNIIGVYLDMEEYDKALEHSEMILKEIDDEEYFIKATILSNSCIALTFLGRLEEAEARLLEVDEIIDEQIDNYPILKQTRFYSLMNWAEIHEIRGDYEEGMKAVDDALLLVQQSEYWVSLCMTLQKKTVFYLKMEDAISAEQYAALALDAATPHEARHYYGLVYDTMTQYYKKQREWRKALGWSERKADFHKENFNNLKKRSTKNISVLRASLDRLTSDTFIQN